MGRTIHFDIRKTKGPFTKSDKRKLIDISAKYNSGEYENFWTCENFFVGAFYFPNWEYFKDSKGYQGPWDIINSEMEELEKTMHTFDAIEALEKKGLIIYQDYKEKKNEVHGFVKTKDNEANTRMVVKILVEISKEIKNTHITVSDERNTLGGKVCSIKNGKIQALIPDDIKESTSQFEALDAFEFLAKSQGRPIPEEVIVANILNGHKDKVGQHFVRSDWEKFMYEHVA